MTNTYTVMTTAYYQDMMVTSSAQGQKGKKPLPERSFPNFRDCVKSEAHGHSLNMSGLDDLSITSLHRSPILVQPVGRCDRTARLN